MDSENSDSDMEFAFLEDAHQQQQRRRVRRPNRQQRQRQVLKLKHFFPLLKVQSIIKLGFNELGYNEHTVITNKISLKLCEN